LKFKVALVEFRYFGQAFAKGWSASRAFVRAKRRVLWKVAYFLCAALIFVTAAHKRFSLPQDPLAVFDAYLLPALIKLSGGAFGDVQGLTKEGLNFLYPGVIYLILRTGGDFRAISVIQHSLGLIAGGLFLAGWSRLADFFPRPCLNRVVHEAIGLLAAAIYLLSYAPVFFEMNIRSDSVCMLFEILIFWLTIQFFYYRVILPNAKKAVIYGASVATNAFLLALLKPSFTLTSLFVVAPVIWLILTTKGNFTAKVAVFATAVPIIVALIFTEHYLRRNDQSVKTFLAETLFVYHAKIIHAQMTTDLKNDETGIYSREWLRAACDDLGKEIERSHNLYPEKFSVLGFYPDYLVFGHDSLLRRWQQQLGDQPFLSFLKYWYWHSAASRPLAFAEKVAGQLGVFYSTNCPAFRFQKTYSLSTNTYCRSLAALSWPQSLQLLSKTAVGSAFLERTKTLCSSEVVIHQNKLAQMGHVCFARSYLAVLLISAPLAGWFLLKRINSEDLKWSAFFVIFFYSVNFGNVFSISVVHSMEVDRYSSILFIGALFAQLWSLRWLLEIALMKLLRSKRARLIRFTSGLGPDMPSTLR
jgi:hypothetical protein